MRSKLHPNETKVLDEIACRVSRVLVTGGGGFLGRALCRKLLQAGIEVNSYSRRFYPELADIGVRQFQGDLTDIQSLQQACSDCQLVFHLAAKAGVWGERQDFLATNLDGTANVIAACQQGGINYLVYTSSPAVIFAGEDASGVDERAPYAETYLNDYAESKARAEKMLLRAQGAPIAGGSRLNVVALRPQMIWGPGDRHLYPRILSRRQYCVLQMVGSREPMVDSIYIDNAVFGHLLAAETLLNRPVQVAGKVYFLSDDEPMPMAELLKRLQACTGREPVIRRLNARLLYLLGGLFETLYTKLGLSATPPMTRYIAKQLTCCHYCDISAAKQDLDYRPLVSVNEGLRRLSRAVTRQN